MNKIVVNIDKIAGNPKEIAQAFGLSVQTLAKWRCEGKGPKYRKAGEKLVIYMFDDVQEFLNRKIVQTKDSMNL